MIDAQGPLIYLVACEPSADHLGAHLMKALKRETGGKVRFAGIGGTRMTEEGLETLFDPGELALLGIVEVIPAFRRVLRRVDQTLTDIAAVQPDILVTIDSWGFTGRLHQRLARARSTIPRMRYVAPQVWAWRPGRARQLARWIDHLMALLPFEPPYFTKHGLPTTWVGHPVIESGADKGDGGSFLKRHGLAADATVLTVLPGSRRGEVSTLLPIFKETVAHLAARHPGIAVVIPTVAPVAALVDELTREWGVPVVIIRNAEAFDAFAASRVALSASGTVSLELAMAGVPHVVAYRVNALSALAFRLLSRTRFVNLVNVLVNREAVPELLQEKCTPLVLAGTITHLLRHTSAVEAQRLAFREALARLAPVGERPSTLAARSVLGLIKR